MFLKKRFTALAMAGIVGTLVLFPAGEARAEAWSKVNGTYQMIDGSSIDGVHARGIDVSHWKQNIDWNAVANDDVQFVMLGTRYKGDVDPYFRINADGAHAAGIKLGAYIYSYATSVDMALAEADFVLNLIKDYPISYPVAFDAEDSSLGALPPSQVSAIINAFCERIAAAGYYPMVYANDNWLANKIDMSQIKYDVWVARYQVKHSYQSPAMWQATSTGRVNGVQGNVDIDFQYKDFSGLIPANTWRTIGGNTYYYQNFSMMKSSWIDDGNGWYYMDQNGQPSKGLMTASDGTYYLDDSTGKMITGWKQMDEKWHYFSASGRMAKGWVLDNNRYFYLNNDGVMATGWLEDNGKHYFLNDSGAMVTNWKFLDNSWYYFNGDGSRAAGWANLDGNWYYLDPSNGKMASGWLDDGTGQYYLSTNSGKMTIGWRDIDGSWYYFDGSGRVMKSGLTAINDVNYYLDPSTGKMAVNTTITVDGTDYTVDGSGVCTKVVPPETNPEASPSEISGNNSQAENKPIGPGM